MGVLVAFVVPLIFSAIATHTGAETFLPFDPILDLTAGT